MRTDTNSYSHAEGAWPLVAEVLGSAEEFVSTPPLFLLPLLAAGVDDDDDADDPAADDDDPAADDDDEDDDAADDKAGSAPEPLFKYLSSDNCSGNRTQSVT